MKLRLFASCRAPFALVFVLVLAATGCNQFNLGQKSQTISFSQIPNQTLGAAPLPLAASASSGLPVSFASNTPAVCSVSGTTASGFSVVLIAAGTCSIVATQAGASASSGMPGNVTYESAAPVTQSFTVNPVSALAQTITFTDSLPTAATYTTGLTYPISATGGGSGNPVTFSVTGPATLSGGTLSITGTGTVTVTANQAGNTTYAAAPAATQSIVLSALIAQTVTFTDSLPTAATYTTGVTYPISATGGGSGNPVTFTVTGPATLSGGTLSITGTGTVTVTANQAGNATYAAAPTAPQSIVLSALTAQTITFTDSLPTAATYNTGLSYPISATGGGSGNPVTFTVTGPATLSGGTLAITGTGTVTVTANQAGNATYAAAPAATQSIVLSTATQTTAIITSFTASSSSVALGSQVTLRWVVTGATSLDINQQVGPVTGTSVNVTPAATGPVTYTLTANSAAGPVTKSVVVTVTASSAPTITSFTASAPTVVVGSPVTLTWAVTGATSLSISPAIGTVTGISTSFTPSATGTVTYTLTATNASGSSTSIVTLVVTSTLQPPVVTLSALSDSITLQGVIQLSWTESGAASLSIDKGVGALDITKNSIDATPTAAGLITYTITATNAAGSTTASVTVNVVGAQAAPTATPPYPRIAAAGSGYNVNSPITLNFSAPGATSLNIDQGVGTVTGTTSATVTPKTAGLNTYTLTATNDAGTASAFVTVNVTPATAVPTAPSINSFTAANSAIVQGSPVTLTWSVTGATSLSIDSGVGTVTGQSVNVTPANLGSNTYTLKATNTTGNTTAQVTLITSATAPTPQPTQIADCTPAGMSPICVPFLGEALGGNTVQGTVFDQAWGAAGEAWPDQLFWQDVPQNSSQLNDMILSADSIASSGALPLGGNMAWGYDLINGNGGEPNFADYSQDGGYKQYAAWMDPREGTYFAIGPNGEISYPGQGYVSFGMPMLADDLPSGSQPESFGKWAGESLGNMALAMHLRGYYDADFFIGVYIPDDWHPRLVNSFEAWSGTTVPGATVPARANYIAQNQSPLWTDFVNAGQVSFLAEIGNTLLANGVNPVSGGQLNFDPAYVRATGSDPRAWETQLPGNDWIFLVENESQSDRATPAFWTASYSIGASASRVPDVSMGVDMDANCSEYAGAVSSGNWSQAEANGYLKHLVLSAGWTHLANRGGSVRRGAQVIQRCNWDAGSEDPNQMAVMREHIPTHPFGPAFYYSDNVERYYESPNAEWNSYNFYGYLQRGITTSNAGYSQPQYYQVAQGINLGYWVSDATDPSTLKPADIPSAWLLYDSNHLPAGELAKLQAVAPVYDLMNAGGSGSLLGATAALAAGPVHATGTGLNMLAFVDQNNSVVVMVTNQDATDQNAGALVFNDVTNGNFNLIGLLGTASTTMTVTNNVATVPISVAAYDTVVYEIPALKWIGH